MQGSSLRAKLSRILLRVHRDFSQSSAGCLMEHRFMVQQRLDRMVGACESALYRFSHRSVMSTRMDFHRMDFPLTATIQDLIDTDSATTTTIIIITQGVLRGTVFPTMVSQVETSTYIARYSRMVQVIGT